MEDESLVGIWVSGERTGKQPETAAFFMLMELIELNLK